MLAISHDHYGQPADALELRHIDTPAVGDGEVLVRVHAASIHVGDWIVMQGVPYIMRPMFGLRAPKVPVPGTDMAGVVEAVGAGVTHVKPGDEVFGWGDGAFAEYMSTPAGNVLPKPADFSFEQAAAVGVSAFTALKVMRDRGQVRAGQRVLINGASGGVGTYAVQMAKSMGAEVTGVCSAKNAEMVRSIGADHVIDYTQEDFTQGDARYDFILDNVGNHSFSKIRRVLSPDGRVQPNGGGHHPGRWFGSLGSVVSNAIRARRDDQLLAPFLSTNNAEDLVVLKEMAEAGKIVPVIDSTYPLAETAKAMSRVGGGHASGTVVITV
jgi:NADPH:quinone reductase-like Zn-dependent oxidoreductase